MRGVAGRPMILKRFRRGISAELVLQRAPANRPDWVDVAELLCVGAAPPSGGSHDAAGLAWVINLGCVDASKSHQCSPAEASDPERAAGGLGLRTGVAWQRVVEVALVSGGVAGGLRLTTAAEDVRVAGLSRLCPDRACWSFPRCAWPPRPLRRRGRNGARRGNGRWWKEEREGVRLQPEFRPHGRRRPHCAAATPMPGNHRGGFRQRPKPTMVAIKKPSRLTIAVPGLG